LHLAKQNNCYDFYFQILNDEIHQENIFARFGNQSEEIINNFLFICQDFSQNNNHNLQNFLEFCEQIDPEISLDLSNSNAVKISTVHSSKGLQAPIIILPDTIYNYYQQNDNKVEILWNQNFPLWLNADSNINPKIKNLTDDLKYKSYEEHLRLLYVALTRAQDEIYIGGCAKDFDDKCWYHIINNTKDDEFNYKQVEFVDNSYFLPKNNNINDFYLKLSDFNYFIDQ
ncbi:MAG: 3'-5' exonuclease, partial [Alphaproteobacteria bacterium]